MHTTLGGDTDNVGSYAQVGTVNIWEITVPSFQFYCEPKTAQKKKNLLKKKKTQKKKQKKHKTEKKKKKKKKKKPEAGETGGEMG